MSDSQNIPVFVRHYADDEPRFLGRFPLDQLADLVDSFADHSCFWGDDNTTDIGTQYICYESHGTRRQWFVGFEIILGLKDDEMYKGS